MDFSFINSVLRSSSFPPIDPWTSGTYLNYYYYGHYLVAMLIKLAGIPPKVGYNLAFCLIPALVVSGVFSIVFSLTGKVRYGIFGGACAGLLGNLDGFFLLIDGRPWRSAFYRALHLSIPTHPESVFRFFRCAHEVIQNTVHEFPFWSFIFVDLHAHVIAMPFAVLLCALALSLFMNPRRGLGFRGRGGEGASDFFIAAVALGMMIPMNTWDFPTYTAALGVLMLLKELHRRNLGGAAIPLSGYSFWWDARLFGRVLRVLLAVVRLEGRAGGAIRAVARTAVLVSLLAASAIAAYSPFFQFFGREGMGIGLVGGLTTRLGAELRFFGFFLFIIASFLYCECARWVNGRPGRAARALFILLLLAAALSPWAAYRIIGTRDYGTLSLCLALLLPGLLALFRLRAAPPAVYSLVLICYGLAVAGFCELFHIRDFLQGGEWKRMNTIFKFYMPVWFFFSIGGSYCLSRLAAYPPCRPEGAMRLLSLGKRAIWTAVFCALLAASLVFTVMGPRARTIGDDNYSRSSLEPPFAPRGEANREGAAGFLNLALPRALRAPTLDGLAWMKDRFPDDYEAVSWLGAAVPGQPVIIEATGADYLYDFARVSSNTGIPAVLGWWSHVDQRGYAFRDVRRKDVADFYKSSDPAELAALIAKYDIGYVYVGNTERLAWSPDELKKFDLMTGLFRPVFRNGNAAVYQTRAAADVAPSSPAGGAAVPPPEAAAPHVKLTERSEGDGPGEYNEPRGVALDRRGGVYVADFRNYRIQKFDPKGFYVAAWGEEGSYPGQFKDPCDVAVDEKGRVYVADTFNHRIQVLSPEGKFLFAVEGGFFAPRGVAVDMKGRIWVADTGNSVVKVFSSDGAPLMTIGRKGRGREEFDGPNSLAVNRKGRVYVADTGNRRVQILDRNGRYAGEFKVDGWQAGVFDEPYLDVDARGDIYLTDPPGNRALRYSADGTLLGTLAPREGSEPMLLFPMGIAVENEGRAVYIVDCRHNRVRAFTKGDFK